KRPDLLALRLSIGWFRPSFPPPVSGAKGRLNGSPPCAQPSSGPMPASLLIGGSHAHVRPDQSPTAACGITEMQDMPEKSPDLWAAVLAWLSVYAPQLYAPALSVVIAVLRVIYGGGTKRQMFLEGALCGLATLTLVP